MSQFELGELADRADPLEPCSTSGSPLLLITGLGASLDLAQPFERDRAWGQAVAFDAHTVRVRPRRSSGKADETVAAPALTRTG
jgi:hypothetical protein